jgi:hypothetical protein
VAIVCLPQNVGIPYNARRFGGLFFLLFLESSIDGSE